MTITLYLQKETLLRDLATLQILFRVNINSVVELRVNYDSLSISTTLTLENIAIQVTPEEFALIGMFNGAI